MPRNGPVLLVANHPNSLLDPMLVVAAAGRPVRFLAKAPLFSDPKVGWLVRAAGAIPVFRRIDDATATARNVHMFQSVFEKLGEGAAVGLFPEGISHSGSSLAPFKTGAARIALGSYERHGRLFPIVPVGIVLGRKNVFRSRAHVILGAPVTWDDVAPLTAEDPDAVRELTRRLDDALRAVTLNLERWEDEPLVRCAERIWAAEWGAEDDPALRVARLRTTTDILAAVREQRDPPGVALIRDVAAHDRRLRRLGLHPGDLSADIGLRTGLRWAVRRFRVLALPTIAVGILGWLAFYVPFQATARLARIGSPPDDQQSTHKLLSGIVLYSAWLVAVTVATSLLAGLAAGLSVLGLLPILGIVGLRVREQWRGSWRDARNFTTMRSRKTLMEALRRHQRALAVRLKQLHATWTEGGITR